MAGEDLLVLGSDPLNAETPLHRQTGILTPAARHYIRAHFATPAAPTELIVEGAVRAPGRLTVGNIRALPARSLVVTLECAGNARSYLQPPTPGEQWGTGAVSTAEWTGASLRDVLDAAGPLPGAVEVLFAGADSGVPKDLGQLVAYERSLPIGDALGGDAILAYAMNGDALTPEHGAPLRLVMPGWYGMASVKWLTRVRVLERPFAGFYQTQRYVIEGRPLRDIAPRALVIWPRDGERVAAGALRARGYCWTGRGTIAAVRVSTDGGHTWRDADLSEPVSRYAWRTWEARLEPLDAGELLLIARAVADDGAEQPLDEVWNPLGYGNNAVRPVRVRVG